MGSSPPLADLSTNMSINDTKTLYATLRSNSAPEDIGFHNSEV